MTKEKSPSKGKLWLKKEMRPYMTYVLFLTVVAVITTALSLAFAYMVRYLINSATAKNATALWIFSAVLLGVLLLRIALQTLSGYCAERLRAKIVVQLRTKIFSKILRSDFGQVQNYHSGELITRLTADINEVSVDTVGLLPAIVSMIVQCLGAIVALLTIDPLFTAIYVVCGCMFGGITALFRKEIKKRQKDVLQADGASRSFMQESLSSVMTLKAYGAETKTSEKVDSLGGVYFDKRMKRNVVRTSMSAVFTLLSNFGLIFAIIWCSVSVLVVDTPDYGSILSVILLLMQLQHPFSSFSSLIPVYYARMASGERLQELDALPVETVAGNTQNVCALYQNMQAIAFENVTFDYGRERVLTNANAEIKKGEIVCVTGASGAGKSTLFKLLLNVFTPTSGDICLLGETGESLIKVTARERGLFAYVPQGNFLFSGTIYENLTFFADEITEKSMDERVKSALEIACADFVWDLPQGVQTPLLEGGNGLSEGQMQRLAVARAILSDRPILLLDEATSALDSETERKLLENIKALQNKTCIIVTHREMALTIADRILRVEKGQITK